MIGEIFGVFGKQERLTALADGELSADREEAVREEISRSPDLEASFRAITHVKEVLHQVPRLEARSEFKTRTLELIAKEPPPPAGWLDPALGTAVFIWRAALMMPRAVLIMGVIGVLSLGTIGKIMQLEGDRTLRVIGFEGSATRTVRGAAKLVQIGEAVRIGEPIETGADSTLQIRRQDLFTLQMDPETQVTFKRFSKVGGVGENEMELAKGAVLFKTERQLGRRELVIQVPWFSIVNLGTVALIDRIGDDSIRIAVLEGSLLLKPTGRGGSGAEGDITVQPLREFTFKVGASLALPGKISQDSIDHLLKFDPSQRIALLSLPAEHAAASLVDAESIKVVFGLYEREDAGRKPIVEEAVKLYQRGERGSLREAVPLLERLANSYRAEGRLDASVSIQLFTASILAYLDKPERTLEILGRVAGEVLCTDETRALAQVAMGIIEERLGRKDRAKKIYHTVLDRFRHARAAREASERLKALEQADS